MKLCDWCHEKPAKLRFCGRKCRQRAHRLRKRTGANERAGEPGVFAYADPPYPGLAERYYGDQPTFKGEVDHGRLLRALTGALEGDENRSLDEALAVGIGWSTKKLTGFAVSTSVEAGADDAGDAGQGEASRGGQARHSELDLLEPEPPTY